MAAIVWDDVVNGTPAPELDGKVPALAQVAILDFVNDEALDADALGGEDSTTLRRARCYLAAHIATMGLRAGVPGPITAETAGRLTTTFATFGLKRTYYATAYGVLFDQLLNTLPIRAGFAT